MFVSVSMYVCFLGRNVTTRILGLPQSIAIDQRSDKKFRQIFIGASATAGEGRENKQLVTLLLPQGGGGRAGSLCGIRVAVCPRIGPKKVA